MVEISLSGSGEGSGWVTAPGYSTAAFWPNVRVWALSNLCWEPRGGNQGRQQRSFRHRFTPFPPRSRSSDSQARASQGIDRLPNCQTQLSPSHAGSSDERTPDGVWSSRTISRSAA